MIAFGAHQLGVPPAAFADNAQRDQIRTCADPASPS
jgi:hypothetical protein